MKIIALKAENIKKLVAVEIRPDGNIVEITGKNGQGKTSVLDSIWWALCGAGNIQRSPIRNGADTGFVTLDLGEMIVTRTFKKNKEGELTMSLSVQNKEGVKFTSPQAMLDKMLGDFAFDPLAFARSSASEQFEKLRTFVPDVDFKAIDEANKKDYEERKAINRQAKEKRAAAEQIITTAIIGATPVDESELIAEMRKAGEQNADIQVRINNRKQMQKLIGELRQKADQLISEADSLQQKLDNAPKLPEIIDITNLEKQIAIAREINLSISQREQKTALESAAFNSEQAAKALTDLIEQRIADKQAKIAAAKLPVPGLSFGEDHVLLNGVPFEQASDAEQLRASVAIAMALNPKLRVIRVRDGSLLDDDSMKILAEMADKNDCQVWIERVDGTGKVGFVLEDGHIRQPEINGEPEIC